MLGEENIDSTNRWKKEHIERVREFEGARLRAGKDEGSPREKAGNGADEMGASELRKDLDAENELLLSARRTAEEHEEELRAALSAREQRIVELESKLAEEDKALSDAEKTARLKTVEAETAALRVQTLQDNLTKLSSQLSAEHATQQTSPRTEYKETLESQVAAASVRIAALESQLAQTTSELAVARSAAKSLEHGAESAKACVEACANKLHSLKSRLDAEHAAGLATQAEAKKREAELLDLVKEKTARIESLKSELDKMEKEIEAEKGAHDSDVQELERTRHEAEALAARLAEAQASESKVNELEKKLEEMSKRLVRSESNASLAEEAVEAERKRLWLASWTAVGLAALAIYLGIKLRGD